MAIPDTAVESATGKTSLENYLGLSTEVERTHLSNNADFQG